MLQNLGERVVWSLLLYRCGMGNSATINAAQEEKHFQNQFLRYGRLEMFVNLVQYYFSLRIMQFAPSSGAQREISNSLSRMKSQTPSQPLL